MSKQVLFSLLDRANNGNEILAVIDSFAADLGTAVDYIEGYQIEQALGIPTLEAVQF